MPFRTSLLRSFVITLLALLPVLGRAQPIVEGADRPIDAPTRAAVIATLAQQLQAQYVFPEVADRMEQTLRQQLAAGAYDQYTSSQAFARAVTDQLQQASHDKHLRLFYQQEALPAAAPAPAEERAAQQAYGQQVNFGFGRAERLAGNVGYLRLDECMPVELAAETASAAMAFLQNTDALVLDLRNHHGGEPALVAYLASYFFGPEPVHLNDIVRREKAGTGAFWTRRELPGRRYLGKPVYILTSRRTFSAGEELAYDLQSLGRATVVGEPTAGGAHAGEQVRVGEHFTAFIPTEYAANPVTHTNWEGTGVCPDIASSETDALNCAHLAAIEALRRQAPADCQLALTKLLAKLQANNATPPAGAGQPATAAH